MLFDNMAALDRPVVMPDDLRIVDSATLNTYTRDPKIRARLTKGGIKYKLLNYKDFVNWLLPLHKMELRRKPGQLSYLDKRLKYANVVLQYISKVGSTICGKTNVNEGYADAAPQLPFFSRKFDIIVSVIDDERYDRTLLPLTLETAITKRIPRINGFIVGELGECKVKPTWWSVRLICTSAIKGIVLMGAFLYCIKTKYPNDTPDGAQNVLLEVANGYENIAGYKSYSRIGFEKKIEYYGPKCFYEFGNIPMHINLGKISLDTIINRVVNDAYDPGIVERDQSGILSIYDKLNPLEKKRLIDLNSDLLMNELKQTKDYPRELRIKDPTPDGFTRESFLRGQIDILKATLEPDLEPDLEPVLEPVSEPQLTEKDFTEFLSEVLSEDDIAEFLREPSEEETMPLTAEEKAAIDALFDPKKVGGKKTRRKMNRQSKRTKRTKRNYFRERYK